MNHVEKVGLLSTTLSNFYTELHNYTVSLYVNDCKKDTCYFYLDTRKKFA